MKLLLLSLSLFTLLFISCNLKSKGKKEIIGEFEPSMKGLPFWDLPLAQARKIAFRRFEKEKQRGNIRQLLVLILEEGANVQTALKQMGWTRKDQEKWEKSYLSIVLHSNEDDAQKLIQQYH